MAVWRKVGNEKVEKLFEVGGVNEYPASFEISPDKKYLLVNLESKLQIYNFETKELKDFFIPKKQVYSYIFSPDGRTILILDQTYASRDYGYLIHKVEFPSGSDAILRQDDDGNYYFFSAWRSDNKIILGIPQGDASSLAYYDLNNNELVKIDHGGYIGFGNIVSGSGNLMSVVNSYTDDSCNTFSGSAEDGFDIVEPISGQKIGQVKAKGRRVSIVFSPDDKELIYTASSISSNREICDEYRLSREYYEADVTGKNLRKMSEGKAKLILAEWADNSQAKKEYPISGDGRITIGNNTLVSGKGIELIADFYQTKNN